MPSINPVSHVCEILPTKSLCTKCNSVSICLECCRKKILKILTKCHDVMKSVLIIDMNHSLFWRENNPFKHNMKYLSTNINYCGGTVLNFKKKSVFRGL